MAIFVTFLLTIVITMLNGKVGMNLCEYNNPVFFVLGGIIGTLFVLLISKSVQLKIFKIIGKYSLIIMGTHLNIIILIEKIFDYDELPSVLWIPVFIGVVLLEVVFVAIYRRIGYKIRGKNDNE